MIRTTLLALFLTTLGLLGYSTEGLAYSYASPQSDPLIIQRKPFLSAVNKGDWSAAQKAYSAFLPDITVLNKGDDAYPGDSGLKAAFDQALADKDATAARTVLRRAYVDQIHRRLLGTEKNIKDFQTAKILMVTARTFYLAMAGDFDGKTHQAINTAMQKALDAIGKPGVFGYGQKAPDPAAFESARKTIMSLLQGKSVQ